MTLTLGEKLRTLRADRHLTQKAVAEQLRAQHIQVSQQSLSLYEQNKIDPGATVLRGLADLYHISLDWLIRATPCCHGRGDGTKTHDL